MIKFLKTTSTLFYFLISLFFMENLLRIAAIGRLLPSGIFFSLVFSASFAIILYLVCGALKGRLQFIFSITALILLGIIFSSQLIYYKCFKTFYTFYSAGNAGQVFEFWRDILTLLYKNALWIILFFLPAMLFIPIRKSLLSFKRLSKSYVLVLCLCVALFHSVGLIGLYAWGENENSPYSLYFKDSSPLPSVEKLGLVTTMRLDLKKHITGYSPASTLPAMASGSFEKESDAKLPEETKVEYNIMNIDFSKLIDEEANENIKDMHKYFSGVKPTPKNEYTGRYKGYNLILITAEGFSPYAVREDVTPTLYKMVHGGFNFTNFYTPLWGVSTSDGEYVACTSLIPKSGIWSFEKSGSIYIPLVMGNQLKKLGYKTTAYHNHTYSFYKRHISHPNMGYEYKALGKGLSVKKTWPESDLEMMEKTVPEYIGSSPFHTYYMTVSGHLRYSFEGNSMSLKNKKSVENLPYSEASKAYIACQIELDRALEHLMKKLEEAGIAEKTLIAISPDHYPYGLEKPQIDELAGHSVEKNFELYKSTFILYSKGMTPTTIDKPCSSLDILPTLSNLLGIEYDSRLLMGRDILSNSEPLVVFLNKSYITDKGKYNSETGEFIPNEGVSVDDAYIKKVSAVVEGKFQYSAKILEIDYYSKVFKK